MAALAGVRMAVLVVSRLVLRDIRALFLAVAVAVARLHLSQRLVVEEAVIVWRHSHPRRRTPLPWGSLLLGLLAPAASVVLGVARTQFMAVPVPVVKFNSWCRDG
jgi:hypothetical protein